MIYFFFIDQFLIEAIFIGSMFILMSRYAVFFKLTKVPQSARELSFLLLRYLPFFLVVFFVLNPITQTFRYILRNGEEMVWEVYFHEYLFSIPLYITYTFFSLLIGYAVLLIRIFQASKSPNDYPIRNTASDRMVGEFEAVSAPILFTEMMWIAVEDRKYWAQTLTKRVRLHKKINELESMLPAEFFYRINRSTIVNINFVEKYSSWESGTYLIEMKAPHKEEFVISRGRVKGFKRLMNVG